MGRHALLFENGFNLEKKRNSSSRSLRQFVPGVPRAIRGHLSLAGNLSFQTGTHCLDSRSVGPVIEALSRRFRQVDCRSKSSSRGVLFIPSDELRLFVGPLLLLFGLTPEEPLLRGVGSRVHVPGKARCVLMRVYVPFSVPSGDVQATVQC